MWTTDLVSQDESVAIGFWDFPPPHQDAAGGGGESGHVVWPAGRNCKREDEGRSTLSTPARLQVCKFRLLPDSRVLP